MGLFQKKKDIGIVLNRKRYYITTECNNHTYGIAIGTNADNSMYQLNRYSYGHILEKYKTNVPIIWTTNSKYWIPFFVVNNNGKKHLHSNDSFRLAYGKYYMNISDDEISFSKSGGSYWQVADKDFKHHISIRSDDLAFAKPNMKDQSLLRPSTKDYDTAYIDIRRETTNEIKYPLVL